MAEFGTSAHNITSDGLFEWIDSQYPEISEEEIEHLVDGADIDGDGNVNFIAYADIVCEKILNLSSVALQVIIYLLCARSNKNHHRAHLTQ